MDTVRGPLAQLVAGGLVYQVTLASGAIVTNPGAFGEKQPMEPQAPTVVLSEAGDVLAPSKAIAQPTR
jgi:hypothetical protein